jgi:hypothetical protein
MQTKAYVDAVIADELRILAHTRANRNNQLYRTAVRLYGFVKAGLCTGLDDQLYHAAAATGLSDREIRSTMRSAFVRAQPVDTMRWRVQRVHHASLAARDNALVLPTEHWMTTAERFVAYAQDQLWDAPDEIGLNVLAKRGINALTVFNAGIGWNPQRITCPGHRWGRDTPVILPAGIVMPYTYQKHIVKIEIRHAHGKYIVPGSANALWNADAITPHRAVVLVEGVINALTIQQCAPANVIACALGAATHGRVATWIARLNLAPVVLVATDYDPAGEQAAHYWLSRLGRAVRWRPYVDDANTMLQSQLDVQSWIETGLSYAREVLR